MDCREESWLSEFQQAPRKREAASYRNRGRATAQHDELAATSRKENRSSQRIHKTGGECLREPTSSCSACAPKAWTWSSVIQAARSCRCTTRSRAVAYVTY